MNSITNKKFENKNARELTQFLRGDVMVYIDEICSNSNFKEYKIISDLMESFLNMYVKYIKII